MSDYGILTDLQTGASLRPATREEWLTGVRLVAAGRPEGAFDDEDGRAVFVAGGWETEDDEPSCLCGAVRGHADRLELDEDAAAELTADQVAELRRIAAWLGREHKRDPWTKPEAAYAAAVAYMGGHTDIGADRGILVDRSLRPRRRHDRTPRQR